MKRIIPIFGLAALLSGCVYPYQADIKEPMEGVPVIEGNIVIGGTSTVTVRSLEPLTKADMSIPSIYLEDSSGKSYDKDDTQSSRNRAVFTSTATASQGLNYRIRVVVNGKEYVSEWLQSLPQPVISQLEFQADDQDVSVLLSLKCGDGGEGYAAIDFEEVYQFHAEYLQQYSFNPKDNSVNAMMKPNEWVYWCWATNKNLSTILLDYSATGGEAVKYPFHSFPRTDRRNHKDYRISVTVRNISAQEYRYRKTLEDNGAIGGNLFSPEPGDATSNVACTTDPNAPVYGYVNISQTVTAEARLDNKYLVHRLPKYLLESIPANRYRYFYNTYQYEPIDLVTQDGQTFIGWGPRRCFDCAQDGGTYVNPVMIEYDE